MIKTRCIAEQASPLRVAHVMGKMLGGGLEQVVMNYYRHIDRSRVQFDFIVDEDSSLVPRSEIESLGGRVFFVPPYQNILSYQDSLIHLFLDQGWRVVHSHENALSVFPLRAAKKAGVPVRIAHSHSTAGKGEVARNAAKWVLRRFSGLYPTHKMACSHHAGEWLFGKRAEFEIVRNAIDLPRFDFNEMKRDRIRREFGIDDETFVIGHIGRFVPQKNHSFLLEVFSEIVRREGSSLLILVGEGSRLKDTQSLARSFGIEEKVVFLGQRDDVDALYQGFDVFCLPSNYEGLGMVAVEAQVAGLPTFCSNSVPKEAIVSEIASLMSLSDGPKAWATAILEKRGINRKGRVEEAAKLGYDINGASRLLQSRYEELFAEVAECKSGAEVISR